MNSRSKDIIFLLGAGASADAGIPTSALMIELIEDLLCKDRPWQRFNQLYNHVKSAIHYSAGLRGHFNNQVSYNIETLVNTLYELERNEEHPLYPFIAAWNSRFVSLASSDFSGVGEFRRKILAILKKWMCPEDTSASEYYKGIINLQKYLNFPLPVFSLNYDLCVEDLESQEFRIETGFSGHGPKHVWDWERFEEDSPNPSPQVFLYKLHGSINWKRDEGTKQLFCVPQVESIDADRMELIFGRDFKLDAADPYLFYAYHFRRFVLTTRLVVVVGYGFGDAHINKMLTQGIRHGNRPHLLVVTNCAEDDKERKRIDIAKTLDVDDRDRSQLSVWPGKAKQFLEEPGLAQLLLDRIPKSEEAPF